MKCGLLDSKSGSVITSERALAAMRSKLEQDRRKSAEMRLNDARKELKTARSLQKTKKAGESEEDGKWSYHANM